MVQIRQEDRQACANSSDLANLAISALDAGDMDRAFERTCLLEQFLGDLRSDNPELCASQILGEIRQAALGLASVAFGSGADAYCVAAIRSSLGRLRVEAPGRLPIKGGLAQFKTVESFSHFGIVPRDAFRAAAGEQIGFEPDRSFVIGVRSAGSYFGPAICAALGLPGYTTVRPGCRTGSLQVVGHSVDLPLRIATEDIAELERLVHQRPVMIVVDEGPGTGLTFRAVARALRFLNPEVKLFVFHTRASSAEELGSPVGSVLVTAQEFLDTCQDQIAPTLASEAEDAGYRITAVEIERVSSPALGETQILGLDGYESPKSRIILHSADAPPRQFVAKFLGWGSLGMKRFDLWRKLGPIAPSVSGLVNGVVSYEFVDRTEGDLCEWHLAEVARYFCRHGNLTVQEHLPYGEYLDRVEMWLDGGGDSDWQLPTDHRVGSLLPRLRRELQAKDCFVVETDWKLERDKWVISERQIFKFDSFHCEDYADFPRADILLGIAGFSIEWGLAPSQERVLAGFFAAELGRSVEVPALILGKLVYLHWKIGAYQYIISNIGRFCFSAEAVAEHLDSLVRFRGAMLDSIEESDGFLNQPYREERSCFET